MKIHPSEADFRRWIKCVPRNGDLFFFKQWVDLSLPLLTVEQVKSRSDELWPLDSRSWYQYSLHSANYCIWLPKGQFEKLDSKTQVRIRTEQKKFGIKVLSSKKWSRKTRDDKVRLLKRWFKDIEPNNYDQVGVRSLTVHERQVLRRTRISNRLNRFAKRSGPNCFAAVAACVQAEVRSAEAWMHWPALAAHLKSEKFRVSKDVVPRAGDVLVFLENRDAVHAAFALSEKRYFEKPGQDFYEPYRIASWADRKREWPKAKIQIYRRVADSQASKAFSSLKA